MSPLSPLSKEEIDPNSSEDVDDVIDENGNGEEETVSPDEVQGETTEERHDMDEEEEQEAQVPRAIKSPYKPSQREIDEHDITHCPPRSWCEHCVRGQSKDSPTGKSKDNSRNHR